MNKIKYLLLLFILLFTPKVFAASYNITNKIKAIPNYTSGSYTGYTPVTAVVPNYYNVNTRYNGTLSKIDFYLDSDDWNWSYNKTYTITLNMATSDWRNHFMGPQVFRTNSDGSIPSSASNMYQTGTFKFVSQKQIKFNFKVGSTMGTYTKFTLYSTNTTNTSITGVSNWNLSSILISTTTSSPTPTPVPSSPTPTPQPNNQDIINNQTQNTQNIINNQNQNTQDIIDNNTQNSTDIINNANSNTDDIINNQNENTDKINDTINNGLNNVCANILEIKEIGNCKFANDSGDLILCDSQITDTNSYNGSVSFMYTTGQWRGFNTIDYYKVKPNTKYYLGFTSGATGQSFYAKVNYYNSNKQFISQNTLSFSSSSGSSSWTTPNNASYVRFSFESTNPGSYTFSNIYYSTLNNYCAFGSSTSKLDESTDAINNLNDTMKDESVPIIDVDFDVASDTPISDLLLMPLNLLDKIQVSLDYTCQPYILPFDFFGGNNTLNLPCIDLEDYLGSGVYNTLDYILSFFIAYEIGLMCVSIYNSITSLDDGFNALYEPKHGAPDGASSYVGRHGGGAR